MYLAKCPQFVFGRSGGGVALPVTRSRNRKASGTSLVRLLLCCLCVGVGVPASSAAAEDGRFATPAQQISGPPQQHYLEVIEALDESGYRIVSVTTTLLNRIKIRAQNEYHLREIIVSQASGQILRDAVIEEYRTAPPTSRMWFLPNFSNGFSPKDSKKEGLPEN